MIIETAIALVLIFGILVMFHELGHFTMARLVGIRVDEFAFGFGPKLLTIFKRGDTEYTIHPFPLGGFVKLAGMEPGEEDITDGFQAQAIWKRALVIFAGPFASFLLAVFVFISMGLFWGFPVGTTENRVAMVSPQTEAARIGLRAGDRIVDIDGKKITTGKDMTNLIHDQPGKSLVLTVQRNGKTLTKHATPQWNIYYLGALWSFANDKAGNVEWVADKSAAKNAGIQKGDKILTINGAKVARGIDFVRSIDLDDRKTVALELKRGDKIIRIKAAPGIEWVQFSGAHWIFPGGVADKVSSGSQFKFTDTIVSIAGKKITSGEGMLKILQEHQGASLSVKIMRDDKEKTIVLKPGAQKIDSGTYTAMGLLGFVPEMTREKTGFAESIGKGLLMTKEVVTQTIASVASKRIKEDIGGPILIAKITQSSVARGPYSLVQLIGMLSMSLAIINLMPIPVVDGGHLVILGVEAIRRKRLTREQMQVITLIGMAIIGVIFVSVIWMDLSKIAQGLVPQ